MKIGTYVALVVVSDLALTVAVGYDKLGLGVFGVLLLLSTMLSLLVQRPEQA